MFRFTIRDVLWLTVVVAFGVSWWLDHTKNRIDWAQVRADRRALLKAKEEAKWATVKANSAVEQKNEIVRTAARFGISILDAEPQTRVKPALLGIDF
jgi:hypothetical protein